MSSSRRAEDLIIEGVKELIKPYPRAQDKRMPKMVQNGSKGPIFIHYISSPPRLRGRRWAIQEEGERT